MICGRINEIAARRDYLSGELSVTCNHYCPGHLFHHLALCQGAYHRHNILSDGHSCIPESFKGWDKIGLLVSIQDSLSIKKTFLGSSERLIKSSSRLNASIQLSGCLKFLRPDFFQGHRKGIQLCFFRFPSILRGSPAC